jgi:hypothetical protein
MGGEEIYYWIVAGFFAFMFIMMLLTGAVKL